MDKSRTRRIRTLGALYASRSKQRPEQQHSQYCVQQHRRTAENQENDVRATERGEAEAADSIAMYFFPTGRQRDCSDARAAK